MKVINIIDDDYGCEEMNENEEIKVIIITDDPGGKYIKMPESELKSKNIRVGSIIKLENNKVCVLQE